MKFLVTMLSGGICNSFTMIPENSICVGAPTQNWSPTSQKYTGHELVEILLFTLMLEFVLVDILAERELHESSDHVKVIPLHAFAQK